MTHVSRHRLRGQALLETAIFLPVFLLLLFGVIWAIQQSVINERAEISVRYSGLVSTAVDPYSEWSLYSLYINAGPADLLTSSSNPTTAAAAECSSPSTAPFTNSYPFPGPTSAPFWQPKTTGTVASCTSNNAIIMQPNGGAFVQPGLFQETTSALSVQTFVPSFLTGNPFFGGPFLGASGTVSATQKFFAAPSLNTILQCYPQVFTAVNDSLSRTGGSTTTLPTPIPASPPEPVLTTASGTC